MHNQIIIIINITHSFQLHQYIFYTYRGYYTIDTVLQIFLTIYSSLKRKIKCTIQNLTLDACIIVTTIITAIFIYLTKMIRHAYQLHINTNNLILYSHLIFNNL